MAATALLKHNPKPSDAQIEAAMVNLCRCGTYNAIHAAVHELAGKGGA
jgi:isoquinoline 1-oxidoreductase alpha subunit